MGRTGYYGFQKLAQNFDAETSQNTFLWFHFVSYFYQVEVFFLQFGDKNISLGLTSRSSLEQYRVKVSLFLLHDLSILKTYRKIS